MQPDVGMAVTVHTEKKSLEKMTGGCIGHLMARMNRKQPQQTDVLKTNLRRCLTTFDMTALSVGYIVSSGIYVVTANAAKQLAGPSLVIAFLISGISATLSAFCYAELGARFPRAGSAYTYTYLSIGEFWAFLISWNMILAVIIAAASVARSYSAYIDSLTGGVVKETVVNFTGPIHAPYIAEYFDFLGVGILILVVAFISFGVRLTSSLTNVLSVTNVSALLIVIGVGAYFSDTENWTNPETGGFMPFGWAGVLSASASCFYTYAGFESVCSLGEEAKDPLKSIPRSIIFTMVIVISVYMGVSTVFTLMINYQDIVIDSGLPEALAFHGAYWAKYAVIVGALCGMSTGLMMCISIVGRLVYVMAEDGLLFHFFAVVNKRTQVPLRAIYVTSSLATIFTLILDIDALVDLCVIGMVSSYLMVSASVIILRYRPCDCPPNNAGSPQSEIAAKATTDEAGQLKVRFQGLREYVDCQPGEMVTKSVILFAVFSLATCGFVSECHPSISSGAGWAVAVLVALLFCVLCCYVVILLHQETSSLQTYKIPGAPFTPALSIVINCLLIVNVPGAAWLSLLAWILIGLFVYFLYSIKHSKLEEEPTEKKPPTSDVYSSTTWIIESERL